MGMYQEIDDVEDETGNTAPAPKSSRWVLASMVVAFATLGFVTIMSMPSTTGGGTVIDESPDSRVAYLAALREPSPALRRARLADFALTYPDDSRKDIVSAQLSVLDAHEASDWARVTDVLYDRSLQNLDRIAAIDTYEGKWGPNLLGSRTDEIAALRERFTTEEETAPPSRALEEDNSPIPSSIQGSTMAGGPVQQVEPVIVLAPPAAETFPIAPQTRAPIEVAPRVIRSRQPRYPRAAQRRGVGAMVMLEMDVDAKGRVDEVRIVRVEAERYGKEFARAAERAAKRTRFSPRTLDGQAVPTRAVRKRYRFQP